MIVVADTPDNDLAISYFANQDKLDELSEQLTNMAQCSLLMHFDVIKYNPAQIPVLLQFVYFFPAINLAECSHIRHPSV